MALLIYYRKYLIDQANNSLKTRDLSLFIKIGIATIPAGLIGFFFSDFIDEKLKAISIAAASLILLGLIFVVIDTLRDHSKASSKDTKKQNKDDFKDLGYIQALIIGLFQPLAFVRGSSRSGVTIVGGLSQKLSLERAVNFSFLIGIPIIGAAFLQDTLNLITSNTDENFLHLFTGFIVAFVTGLLALEFMLKFINKTGLKWFGVYRIVLGMIILLTQV